MTRIIRKLRLSLRLDLRDYLISWLGGFLGIGILGLVNSTIFSSQEVVMLIGSFGASAILIFGEYKSPLSQPRNLIGGHVISAFIGVSIMHISGMEIWMSAALAVSLSLLAMKISSTTHPPGGATALIAVIGGEKIQKLGYGFVLFPVATGAFILFIVAYLVNNLLGSRKYPLR
ncbi:MAG: HPP family protein [Cytophagaceae bacterium]